MTNIAAIISSHNKAGIKTKNRELWFLIAETGTVAQWKTNV